MLALLLWLQDPADLIAKLGHDDPDVREAATAELLKLGRSVVPMLEGHMDSDDPEVSARATMIVEQLARIRWGNDLETAMTEARSQWKPLLVLVTHPRCGCGGPSSAMPLSRFERDALIDPDVVDMAQSSFISVRLTRPASFDTLKPVDWGYTLFIWRPTGMTDTSTSTGMTRRELKTALEGACRRTRDDKERHSAVWQMVGRGPRQVEQPSLKTRVGSILNPEG